MNIKKITGKEVKDAVEWLWYNREDGGCYHKVVWTDDETGREWCIVIGWSDGYDDKPEPDDYQDGTWRINWGVRYQERDNGMQCDMDIDFTIPYYKDTGDCYESGGCITRDYDPDKLAEYMNSTAKNVIEYIIEHKEEIA